MNRRLKIKTDVRGPVNKWDKLFSADREQFSSLSGGLDRIYHQGNHCSVLWCSSLENIKSDST